jgi:hypothetical protein
MQTFVPTTTGYADIAKTLDRQRLNKQALEGWQIMMTLLELDPQGNHRQAKGWRNHPAVKMWRGHEQALNNYVQFMVKEWKSRGYKSTIGDKAEITIKQAVRLGIVDPSNDTLPDWLTDPELREAVASSHRVALLNKDYEWYSQFDWVEDTGRRPDTYEYVWPV